jgi:hypothetical protein
MRQYNRITLSIALIAVIAILAMPTAVMSQDVATGSSTATVQAVLAVSATAALAFGNVFQGVQSSIANNAATAGVFTITGQANAVLAIYMQLPDYMATATGDDRMVISFGTTDLTLDSTANVDPTTPGLGNLANQNPHNVPSWAIGGASSQSALFLGGTVTPTVDQTAGAYTADIILTVAYTGA